MTHAGRSAACTMHPPVNSCINQLAVRHAVGHRPVSVAGGGAKSNRYRLARGGQPARRFTAINDGWKTTPATLKA